MAVLSTILPGVRTLRAPLAVGVLVLLAVWLAVAPVAAATEQTGVVAILHSGYDSLSPVAATAVLTAAAYLVGSVVFTLEIWIVEFWIRNAWSAELVGWLESQDIDPDVLDETERQKYKALLGAKRKSAEGFPGELLSPIWASRDPLRLRQEEWRFVRYRLMSQHPELFAELDRLEAEGDLRIAVGPPIAALGIVAVLTEGASPGVIALAALASLAVAGVIMWTGVRSANQSEELVVDVIRAGIVGLPLVEGARRTHRGSRRGWV